MATLTDEMNFQEIYQRAILKNNSLLCIGLDPEYEKLPMAIKQKDLPLFEFNKAIIDETVSQVCAFKFNPAYYQTEGDQGILQLKKTCDHVKNNYPDIPIILDAKFGDTNHNNDANVRFAYDYLKVDAVTLNPYLGKESLSPFLNIPNKGNFILCRTSNPGAGEIQELAIGESQTALYQMIGTKTSGEWNQNNNCMLIIGTPFPHETVEIRTIVGPDMIILLPGIVTQEKDLEKTVRAGINKSHIGIIVNSSQKIIYASQDSNFFIKARETAIKLKDQINHYRSLDLLRAEDIKQEIAQPVTLQDQTLQNQQFPNPQQPKPPESNPSDFTE